MPGNVVWMFVCARFFFLLHSSASRFNGWEFLNLWSAICLGWFTKWEKEIERDTWRKKRCLKQKKKQIILRYSLYCVDIILSPTAYTNRSHSLTHKFGAFHFTFWIENFDLLSPIAFHDMFARMNVLIFFYFWSKTKLQSTSQMIRIVHKIISIFGRRSLQ